MKIHLLAKYVFRIRTKNGVTVEGLAIFGRDEDEARQKLWQIYRGCEILECRLLVASLRNRSGSINYEDVVDLIATG